MDLRRRMLLAMGVSTKPNPDVPVPEPKYGAYIQDTTGKLWSADEWDGSATPNGIAVRLNNIGPKDGVLLSIPQSTPSLAKFASSANNTMEGGMDGIAAFGDYNGYENTLNLAQKIPNSPAITACTNYTFPNGQKGYLGGCGEFSFILQQMSKVNECLMALGKNPIETLFPSYIWSSSLDNTVTIRLYMWAIRSFNGRINNANKIATDSCYVWPMGKVEDWTK